MFKARSAQKRNFQAMPFQVPKQQRDALKELLNASRDNVRRLLDALKEAEPTLGLRRLAKKMAAKAELDVEETVKFLRLFVGLYAAWSASDASTEEFIEEICQSTQDDHELKFAEGKLEDFKSYLQEIVKMRDSIGVTSKALGVMMEHERIFLTSRVVSDFRPIFRDSTTEPAAGVIIHNLKIVYRENYSEERTFYVALDNADLKSLKRTIERAMDKAKSIKSLIGQTKLIYLDPDL
jgi:hypothetical protein